MRGMNRILKSAGLRNEIEFWSQYSGGISSTSAHDHMIAALGKNGYSGTSGDMFRAWKQDMGGLIEGPLKGLTFFKDFTRIPAGVYSGATQSSLLYPILSAGVGTPTFTSTSGSFTITSSGYQVTTANVEVLKYLIAGNRTAAQETIVIKWQTTWGESAGAVGHCFIDSETKRRYISINSRGGDTNEDVYFLPNENDSAGSTFITFGGQNYLANTLYVIAATCKQSSPYLGFFKNGVSQTNDNGTDADFTTPTWGTSFYIGSNISGTEQAEASIKSVAIFAGVKTDNEIVAIGNVM